MSALLSNPAIRDAVVPISVETYHRMGKAGIIDQRTELIGGVILQKMIKSPLHTLIVKQLVSAIEAQLPAELELRKEEPLTFSSSEPEPDIAIVQVGSYQPGANHPSTAQLVVEVAVSSEAIDRAKAAVYAEAQIPEYWIVLPSSKTIERFTHPGEEGYGTNETFEFGNPIGSLPPLAIQVTLTTG
ncbi:Uma2 family endonuclease [Rhodopirellula sp. JC639]|uniref:Uma2 family endonuclease n=1 Tax=Stieleria mannarensis TaxID=2755585 RepID=UPI001602DBE8